MPATFDTIIIGAGPAGISASLYVKRANLNVLVLYFGDGNLEKAHKIDNYYGFPDGISGPELYENGITQAKNLGVEVRKEEVTSISMNDDFSFSVATSVATSSANYSAKSVVIATGNKKLRPQIKGIAEFEGKGVSYCAICDAFFYRKKNVCVIGDGKFAVSEAADLVNVASSVTILTNGKDENQIKKILSEKGELERYKIDSRKIAEIKGENGKVSGVLFDDGTELPADGVFIALGEAGAADFAKKLGLLLKGDSIVVNEKMATNIPGLFSCGNSTGGLLQVSKAVYEGAVAGLSAVDFLREKNKNPS